MQKKMKLLLNENKKNHSLLLHFMHIPEPLKSYEQPTLILVADGLSAKLYRAHERSCDEIEKKEEDASLGDIEHHTTKTPSGKMARMEDEHIKERARKHFFTGLAKELHMRLQRNEYERLVYIVPEQDKTFFLDLLHPEVKSHIWACVPKILTNVDTLTILKKIDALHSL